MYFDGTHPISFTHTTSGIQIDDPPTTGIALDLLQDTLGVGQVRALALDLDLLPEEAITLLSLLDLGRKQQLGALAAD